MPGYALIEGQCSTCGAAIAFVEEGEGANILSEVFADSPVQLVILPAHSVRCQFCGNEIKGPPGERFDIERHPFLQWLNQNVKE